MMITESSFAFAKWKLKPTAKFRNMLLRWHCIPSPGFIIAIKYPEPDIGIILKIIPAQKTIYTIGKLKRVAVINFIKPHQRTQYGGRTKIDLLKSYPELKPGC